jgi:hypothetical protein
MNRKFTSRSAGLILAMAAFLMLKAHRNKAGGFMSAYYINNDSLWYTLFADGYAPNLSTSSAGGGRFVFSTIFGSYTLYKSKGRTHPLYWHP